MELDKIERIVVIGAGLMGHGIALQFAAAGYPVKLHDLKPEFLQRGMDNIQAGYRILVDAGHMTADEARAAVARITPTTDLDEAAGDADVVIEAVSENVEVKRELFQKLDAICPRHTILASNTSTLMPRSLAPATSRPDRVIVAHFWNPPYLLPLVEVVGSPQTSPETVETMRQLLLKIGKQPVVLQKEVIGFIGNRLQFALLREAAALVQKGVATPEDVDTVVKSSLGRRLAVAGPFEVFDLGGWDIIYSGCSYVFPDLDNSTEPPPVMRERVETGELGIKTGKGFYQWTRDSAEALRQRIAQALLWLSSRP